MVWQGIQEAHAESGDNVVITIEMIKAFREWTGGGMQLCKQCLIAGNGDFEKAFEYYRKKS